MTLPTEQELRDYLEAGWSDAMIGTQHGTSHHAIQRLRKTLGISCSRSQYSNGAAYVREIKALVDKDAQKKLARYRFEDSPVAVNAQSGPGPLPPRAEYGYQGGAMIQLVNC